MLVASKKKADRGKKVRRLARALVGTVPPSRTLEPKTRRKKPKHKKPIDQEGS
jgi:hypothetical protein